MKNIVTHFVKGYVLCFVSKPANRKLGLHTPLPIPSRPWESVSMDFLGGFPMSRKFHDYLYVVHTFRKMCVVCLARNKW